MRKKLAGYEREKIDMCKKEGQDDDRTRNKKNTQEEEEE